eukprot:TRINITY_DN9238_c0_g1::TRINITY_DN9238_c0_g1_i1::g.13275::m.13275 TRINITY_DN9238_c0_g1::TRINITY_DN9238_c0_g1_i1::g.13275  ORF type:complete len:145 (+),score=9.16 TRINITY_DN9238_c0_g1_i1:85-519(+)
MALTIILREGVVGGFRGPQLRKQITIESSNLAEGATIELYMLVKPSYPATYQTLTGKIDANQLAKLTENLKPIFSLPVEEPRAGEDIYQYDTTLDVTIGDKHWNNEAPGGCCHSPSTIQPTEEQRNLFGQILQEIVGLATQFTS